MTARRWGSLCTIEVHLEIFLRSSNAPCCSHLLQENHRRVWACGCANDGWVMCAKMSWQHFRVEFQWARLSLLLLSRSSRSREGAGGGPEEAYRGPAGEGAGGQRPEQHGEIFFRPFQETGEVQGRRAGLQKGWRAWALLHTLPSVMPVAKKKKKKNETPFNRNLISPFHGRMKRLWKPVLKTIWPGSRRRSSATRPSKCTRKRKLNSKNWNVLWRQHWSAKPRIESLIFTVNLQGQWRDRWSEGKEHCRDVSPAGAAATGAVEGAVTGEEPGPKGGKPKGLISHHAYNSKRGHMSKSVCFFFFFQEKEAEELTKLCDELISKVQRGWAHL